VDGIPGKQTYRPAHIDKKVWDRLKGMTFVEVADLIDDLEEAARGLKEINASLLKKNLELQKRLGN